MWAECVRHYVELRNTPDHAELIVPRDEAGILYTYEKIQEDTEKAKRCRQVPRPVADLNIIEIVEADEETTAEWAVVFFLSKSQSEREQKFFGQRC